MTRLAITWGDIFTALRDRAMWRETDGREAGSYENRAGRLSAIGSKITTLANLEGPYDGLWEGKL